jgi:hypothetical protein
MPTPLWLKPNNKAHGKPMVTNLPFELQQQIYSIVLDQRVAFNTRYYLSISLVCKQIRDEVLPVIFQDSRYIKSLSHLSAWTSRGTPDLLKHVQNISLHVFTDSLPWLATAREVLHSQDDSRKKDMDPKTTAYWEAAYASQFEAPPTTITLLAKAARNLFTARQENAVALTWKALSSLSNLKQLWINIREKEDPEDPFKLEQQLILLMLPHAFPHLQALTVFSSLLSLSYLNGFHALRSLRWSGYADS